MRINQDDEGGYLVPEVVRKPKPGVWAWCLRQCNHPAGWSEFRLADAIRARLKEAQLYDET